MKTIQEMVREEERERIAKWYASEGHMMFPVAIPEAIRSNKLAQPDYRAVKTYHEGKPVYVAQQNLNCKSTQARLATAWGYVKAQPEQKSFEYWNAVEGWVKIDEVREHFDSVGCGTIYKTAGEDRTPLYTTPPQRTWVGLTEKEILECRSANHLYFYKAVEAKLKEKNT